MCCKRLQPDDVQQAAVSPWRPVSSFALPVENMPSAFREQDSSRAVQDAYQRGLAAGEAAAAEKARERAETAVAALNQMVHELASLRKRFRADVEEDTVKLALAIARRVLHREIATDPEAILGLVIAAFQKLNARETHRLRVSPSDAAVLTENRSRLEMPARLEISADASLPAGSVVFETSRGELDASIDTQFGEIERGFADIVVRRPR